jgi:hypothetical protein
MSTINNHHGEIFLVVELFLGYGITTRWWAHGAEHNWQPETL